MKSVAARRILRISTNFPLKDKDDGREVVRSVLRGDDLRLPEGDEGVLVLSRVGAGRAEVVRVDGLRGGHADEVMYMCVDELGRSGMH